MVRLDHFVINIDNNIGKLMNIKKRIEVLGYPFEPKWGKETKGFKVANIWMGLQYFEMLWLKTKEGGGWKKEWIEKYNKGHRGIIAIYLMTDELDKVVKELKSRGISINEPERISFRCFFGLFKKTMPWRNAFTNSIPGTNLQICFGELDNSEIADKMNAYMVPNSKENGIVGIEEAVVKCDFSNEAIAFLKNLFPDAEQKDKNIIYDMGTTKLVFEKTEDINLKVELKTKSENENYKGNSFEIENVKVITV